MNSLVIGASAGLGRAIAEALVAQGHSVFLLSSDSRDLQALSSDLSLRYQRPAFFKELQLKNFNASELHREVSAAFGEIDSLFCVAGAIVEEDTAPMRDEQLEDLVLVNYLALLKIVNEFLPELKKRTRANCVGIGSIASSRARASNLVYASSKTALEFYFQGLRHSLVGSSCRVQFYRLGYLKSQMTFGKKLLLPAADPNVIARKIVANLDRDLGVVYLPAWWRYIMWVYRSLPWMIYKRLNIK